jgi:hypothetical protein
LIFSFEEERVIFNLAKNRETILKSCLHEIEFAIQNGKIQYKELYQEKKEKMLIELKIIETIINTLEE